MNFHELTSLVKIKDQLDSKFGKGVWAQYEPETLSLELRDVFSKLLLDKVCLLRVFETSPMQAYEDPALFLYAAEVINNHGADFDVVPHLTLLETAYAIHVFNTMLKMNKIIINYPDALKTACTYILRHEGVSGEISPFEFIPKESLVPGQTDEDTKNKQLAVKEYIKHMESL